MKRKPFRAVALVAVLVLSLMIPSSALAQTQSNQSLTFNIASGSTSTTLSPDASNKVIYITSLGLTGTTATTSNTVQGTTVSIASNSVEKARYVIGTQPLALGDGTGYLFGGEPGYPVVITCATGTCMGTMTYKR